MRIRDGDGHFLFLVQNYVAGFIMGCIDHVFISNVHPKRGRGCLPLLVGKLIREGGML